MMLERRNAEAKHTENNPYCSELECACHTDAEYHQDVISSHATNDQYLEALDFFNVLQNVERG